MTAQARLAQDRVPGWLDRVERVGNRLPDPVVIFLFLILLLVAASVIASATGWSAVDPATGKQMVSRNLLSADNVRRLFSEMPATLTGFKPLGFVLVIMLGAAVAERSGLFAAMMTRAMRRVGGRMLSPAIFFIGLASHHASDAAYVVIIPLAALAFAAAGRHPLAGVAIGYAGISGAFAANLVPGQFDVLILSITQTAAQLVDPGYPVNPFGNWWFTATLGLVLLPVAWFVNDRIVEPRLGAWTAGPGPAAQQHDVPDQRRERRGLRAAGVAAVMVVALFAALVAIPGYQPLIDPQASGAARLEPFYASLVAGFALLFFACGWAYGRATGSIATHRDAVAMATKGIEAMAPYLVMAFFAAHFIAMFGWSNLGPVIAIKGAEGLTHLALPIPLLLLLLLLIASVFDLLIGSASAKWTAMAPIVVPMLMLLGVSPELATAAYRMGDSIFNIITPVATNFVLVLALARAWDRDFGVGSLIALMLPFSIAIGLTGFALIAIWSALEIPPGPGAPATYQVRGQ